MGYIIIESTYLKKRTFLFLGIVFISLIGNTYPHTQSVMIQPLRVEHKYISLATWNVRILSNGSRDDSELQSIAEVIERYDLVAVQEVRDTSVLDRLLVILGSEWAYHASEPVGTATVKEIYAYFYKTGLIASLGTPHIFNDPNDDFIREPFVGHFRAGTFDFTLINIHVLYGTVSERRKEIALLDDVISYVDEYNGPENDVILLGDFNFSRDEAAWEITTHQAIIPSTTKTTITETSSYDNFWLNLEATTEYDSLIEVYRFDEVVFQNNDDAASLAVSDHRPVALSFLISLEDDDSEGKWDVTTGSTPFNEEAVDPIGHPNGGEGEPPPVQGDVQIVAAVASPTESESVTIKNFSAHPVDVSDWTLGDLNNPTSYNLPNIVLEPGATYELIHTQLGFAINNSDEMLYLKDPDGVTTSTWEN